MCFVRPYTYATVFYYRSVCHIHQIKKVTRTPLESTGVSRILCARGLICSSDRNIRQELTGVEKLSVFPCCRARKCTRVVISGRLATHARAQPSGHARNLKMGPHLTQPLCPSTFLPDSIFDSNSACYLCVFHIHVLADISQLYHVFPTPDNVLLLCVACLIVMFDALVFEHFEVVISSRVACVVIGDYYHLQLA